uniref:Uncharacterized protein n=1 Tax=Oryza glumipatula TaxID=40148 RepID=A0A0E0AZ85_9ORYZ
MERTQRGQAVGVGGQRGRCGDGWLAWAVGEDSAEGGADGVDVGAQDVGAEEEAEAAEERGGGERPFHPEMLMPDIFDGNWVPNLPSGSDGRKWDMALPALEPIAAEEMG